MSSRSSSPSLPSDNDSEFSSSINEDVPDDPEVIEGEFIPYQHYTMKISRAKKDMCKMGLTSLHDFYGS